MTLREAYEYGQKKLKNAGIEDAVLDAWYLLEFVTGISRAMYFVRMNEEMSVEQEMGYKVCTDTRAKHIPLQHITGVQEFMGFEFQVNEHVLVPRQDTEVLVETVLIELRPEMEVLDMCTGSGCILISLLKHCKGITGVGVDISSKALDVAKNNCNRLDVEATLIESDLFDKVEGKYDVIVSNPPYIPLCDIKTLDKTVKDYEPVNALTDGEDGLVFYKRLRYLADKYLKPGGVLLAEIGINQITDVKNIFGNISCKEDFGGIPRVIKYIKEGK
jgi:release factor glutamine methyltransferase